MKRIILLLASLAIAYLSFAQTKCAGCFIELQNANANGMVWQNDSLKVTFVPDEYFWKIKIENKKQPTATCDWDKTIFIVDKQSSNIVFGNTNRLTMNQPKGTSQIASNTIIEKSIIPARNIDSNNIYQVFRKRWIKKHGDTHIKIIIPIAYNDIYKDYIFDFRVFVPTK